MAETKTQWTPPQGNSSQFGTQRPVTLAATATNGDANGHAEPEPNAGASVQDLDSRGDKSEMIVEWQKRNGIDREKQIKIVRVVHMRYQHPDIPTITKFLKDFGMHLVKEENGKYWWRGYGEDPYVYYCQEGPEKKFLGGALMVESYEDLEKAAKLPGASKIEEMKDAPGGGYMVTVYDPLGFPFNLVYGQEMAPRGDLPNKIVQNYVQEKNRVRKFHRFTPGPAAVHKLGHFGYVVNDFDAELEFYTRNFNLVPTDFLYVPTETGEFKDVGVFMHVDRDQDPVDHHTVFFAGGPKTHVHHASFEVHDFDTQQLGHQWLAKQNYTSVWGVGRHILGSQVFDYWWDTTGNMVEHYADGDLVNIDTPIGWMAAADEALAVWGPEVPSWFLD